MANKSALPTKKLYRELRTLPWLTLWQEEVPRFNQASPEVRIQRVAVIRAVGAGLAENQQTDLKDTVRTWLLSLLQDPSEKIRRYAMAALPKIGAGRTEERELLALLQKKPADREKKFLGQALNKIGGSATLDLIRSEGSQLPPLTEQRAKANLARQQKPSTIRLDVPLPEPTQARIHLRCRTGLEPILSQEIKDSGSLFRIMEIRPGLLTLAPTASFRLSDLFAFRCFSTLSFLLGTLPPSSGSTAEETLATLITSPLCRRILQSFTAGPIRYRLEFVAKGHQRGAILKVAQRAYTLCPDLLNDSREAPWVVEVQPSPGGDFVELRPRISPDPRFPYRLQDVPAASHPPLAAAMARLAGPYADETVWDPFCGSGLELIERVRLTGVSRILGTDLSPDATAAARANWAAALFPGIRADFVARDFREFTTIPNWGPASVSLMITNPPLGKRVPIPNLRGLLEELFAVATIALRPGGRLVWINPLRIKPPASSLRLEFQQTVDLGGFSCRLELLRKR